MSDTLYVPAGSEGGVALGEARVATVDEVADWLRRQGALVVQRDENGAWPEGAIGALSFGSTVAITPKRILDILALINPPTEEE